jgi:hypothetical protein
MGSKIFAGIAKATLLISTAVWVVPASAHSPVPPEYLGAGRTAGSSSATDFSARRYNHYHYSYYRHYRPTYPYDGYRYPPPVYQCPNYGSPTPLYPYCWGW